MIRSAAKSPPPITFPARAVLTGEQGAARLQQLVRRLNLQSPVSSEFILSDLHGSVLAASFPGSTLTSYLWNYNAAICYHARNCGEDEIYRSVYYDNSTYSDRMFVKPVYQDSALLGFLTLYLSGAGWNYSLSDTNFDGVITDLRGNIMYSSKHAFASVDNKFSCASHGSVELNGLRYWVLSETTPDGGAIIYSLVYYPRSGALIAGLIALAMAAAAWYVTARNVFASMAASSAARRPQGAQRAQHRAATAEQPHRDGAAHRPDEPPLSVQYTGDHPDPGPL